MLLFLLAACTEYELTDKGDATAGGTDTATAEECLLDEVAAGSVDEDDACAFESEPGSFTPVVEWQWSSNTLLPGYDDVMMMPAVGDVDGDGMPEVVFTAYADGAYTSAGALMIISGDSAVEEAGWTNIGGYQPAGSGGVALGDLEGDGQPEIIVVSADQRLLALHADGTLLWATEPRSSDFTVMSYPLIADLDGDGMAEVAVGRAVFDQLGQTVGVASYGIGGPYGIAAVADLDMDGTQEVIAGNAAWHRDGSALWANGLDDGWCAVGDFDADGQGEVVSVTNGEVYLLDTDGSVIWGPGAVPGGGGGPPTVADFDGDGQPEVGVAGYSGYVVYDTDGTQLWLADTTDQSSARTGSSVYDFEGDGKWEVVYADELMLWVFDGATGSPVLEEDGHSSWTLFEYPVIVDADADGEAEIVLASNDSINPGWQGITAIGDASGTWAPTTTTWNQHAYHITNVEDDLSIPAHPTMNWLTGHNSYRAGGLRDRPGIPAPNLLASIADACWTCGEDAGSVGLLVQLSNEGTEDVTADVDVAVYAMLKNGDTTILGTLRFAGAPAGSLSPGLEATFETPPLEWIAEIRVRADDPGTTGAGPTPGAVEECHEDDNSATEIPPGCE